MSFELFFGFVGGDDANKEGEGIAKSAGEIVAKGAMFTASAIGVATGVGGAALRAGKLAGGVAQKGGQLISGGIKRFRARGAHAGDVDERRTQKARLEARGKHKAEAQKEAEQDIYAGYKSMHIGAVEARLLAADPSMVTLRRNDRAAFQKKLEEETYKQYVADRAAGLDLHRGHTGPTITHLESTSASGKFAAKQADVEVTRRMVYDDSNLAGWVGTARGKVQGVKAAAAIGGWAAAYQVGGEVKNAAISTGSVVKKNLINVTSPITSSTKNFYNIVMSTILSNAFLDALRGKDGENIKDIGYRLKGRTKAEVDKIVAKQKEEAKETKKLQDQQKAILEVLRKFENEKNSEKE